MIIEALMNLVYNILNSVMSPINIPGLPEDMATTMEEFLGYFDYSKNIASFVFPISLTPFIVVFLAIFAFDKLYPFVMWVLRKIPFLGIE